MFDTDEIRVLAAFSCYIAYGDATGLESGELAIVERWLDALATAHPRCRQHQLGVPAVLCDLMGATVDCICLRRTRMSC